MGGKSSGAGAVQVYLCERPEGRAPSIDCPEKYDGATPGYHCAEAVAIVAFWHEL
jgi:hypothetical protein